MVEDTARRAYPLRQWQRIARLLLNARAMVLANGAGVIVKWDGQRDNGKIYTVVWEGDADAAPRFRVDTDDLEQTLGEPFSLDAETELEPIDHLAGLLAKVDNAARQHLVISLRMIRSYNVVTDHVVILGPGSEGPFLDLQGDSLMKVLEDAVGFIERG